MPTYDYFCKECGYEFYELLKVVDRYRPIYEPCPECGEESIYRDYKLGSGGLVDHGIINADKNMALSGVGDRLAEMKIAHPYMKHHG